MRVVAVSMVKNEADVIEAFCRHTAAFADHLLIFDHQSTDGTGFLLRRLQREGLPLTLFTDDRAEYLQAARTTELMRRAVRDFAADWVVPLDADEFPQPGPPTDFRTKLTERLPTGRPAGLWLKDYAPHPTDQTAELNPVLRLRRRADTLYQCAVKVLVPRSLAANPSARFAPGNHEFLIDGRVVPADQREDVWLAHFPARTPAQVMVKVIQGELQRIAGGSSSGVGGHYEQHFRRLMTMPGAYLADPGMYLRGERVEPAEYWGGALTYPPPLDDWERAAAGLLPFVARLAVNAGAMRDAVHRPAGLMTRVRRWLGRADDPERVEFREGLTLPDSLSGDALGCELTLARVDRDGDRLAVTARARNIGLCVWRARTLDGVGQVTLGTQLWTADGGTRLDWNYHRSFIPADVEPGESLTLDLAMPVPDRPDTLLKLDMVSENVRWFGSVGATINPATLPQPTAAG